MARRYKGRARERLSEEELTALRQKLEAMEEWQVEIEYKSSHTACRFWHVLPPAAAIQELVQAWKELNRRKAGQK